MAPPVDSVGRPATTRGTAIDSGAPNLRAGRRLVLAGGVQGLGVRPAICRLATRMGLAGCVRNTTRGVQIEIEGPPEQLDQFEAQLASSLPAAASLVQVQCEEIVPARRRGFAVAMEPADGTLAARVPEDRGVCTDCLREIAAHEQRRYRYPFTSCTQCGPRYTVIRAMPFERAHTTMAPFVLCPDCEREYTQPGDRRFHAQTTACQACGPRVWLKGQEGNVRKGERSILAAFPSSAQEAGGKNGPFAFHEAVAQLASGKIVAVRGLGGYQLLVDATNAAAVRRLRERKGRRAKPLAVMVASVDVARRLARLDDDEVTAFQDPSAPIVLVRANENNGLAAAIHPHLDTVGLMRPTTPLHAILARDFGRPLVCTSGNREGDPLEYDVDGAEQNLAGVADCLLHHDRPIARPIDDSVVRVIAGRQVTIRLARGLAPLPLELPAMPPTLAVGGYLKAAVAWSNGAQAVLGPHIGDQDTLATRERFLGHVHDWLRLYGFRPEQAVHDMHPDYVSTQWAQRQPARRIAVQHHHAHVAAGMLEQGLLDRQVLGVAWDGTGYGTDGTIWGGEFLVCTAGRFERAARIRPFALPGGEAAIREPWRIAVSMCSQLAPEMQWTHWPGWSVGATDVTSMTQIANRPQLSPITSSAGRLIDAAAALILGIDRAGFDGHAAMRLEAATDREARGSYDFPLVDTELPELDWRPLIAGVVADYRRGVDPGTLSMRFHRSLAQGIIGVRRRWRELPVLLCGGVFQNRLLCELVAERLGSDSQPLGLPGIIPPNDGGLAAGQLVVAAARTGILPCV